MKTLQMYNGEVELTFDERKHAYSYQGTFVPGVTSILRRLDKPALVQWAANMACQFIGENYAPDCDIDGLLKDAKTAHRKMSKSAADIGSTVHECAEKALSKQVVSLPKDPQARKGFEAFMSWLYAHDIRPIVCERMVFSQRWFYAGTCDFFGHIDGELCVLDFKTSSGLYLEMLLQLAAYQIALEEETGDRIDAGWIVRLDKKTGKFEPYRIPYSNLHRDAFLRVREMHELISKMEMEIDGLRKQAA